MEAAERKAVEEGQRRVAAERRAEEAERDMAEGVEAAMHRVEVEEQKRVEAETKVGLKHLLEFKRPPSTTPPTFRLGSSRSWPASEPHSLHLLHLRPRRTTRREMRPDCEKWPRKWRQPTEGQRRKRRRELGQRGEQKLPSKGWPMPRERPQNW